MAPTARSKTKPQAKTATKGLSRQDLRRLGEARIRVSQEARSQEDWHRLWKRPRHTYNFKLGTCWKQCVEYAVSEFATEAGFFIDILGFPTNAFGPDYAMFTSPDRDFFFSVVLAKGKKKPTPPDAIRLQFMLDDPTQVASELESRGVRFEKKLAPCEKGSPLLMGTFRTPHGVAVDIWGFAKK